MSVCVGYLFTVDFLFSRLTNITGDLNVLRPSTPYKRYQVSLFVPRPFVNLFLFSIELIYLHKILYISVLIGETPNDFRLYRQLLNGNRFLLSLSPSPSLWYPLVKDPKNID